ncbi:MAG: sodium:alanine symporter family protein [Verrucomicrobia bacterium A1]|nr:MAG: sodium:alanine symporter family protein [Verrucomicrobia bacterium A1]
MDALNAFLSRMSSLVWGPPMLALLVGTGIVLTFRLRGLQFRRLGEALRLSLSPSAQKSDQPGDISHFQSLMTALSATIGTGNIIGVALALKLGGPGALFWMWMTALVGMATKYAEAILAVRYRVVDAKGEMAGGPMYYLERGLGQKWLGVMFAVFGALAGFGIGNMVQANAIAENLQKAFGTDYRWTGIVLAVLTGLVILGGVKRIGKFTGVLVPVMALGYVAGCLVILATHAAAIPGALWMVIHDAFTGTAAAGGFAGAAMMVAIQKGVSRGVFSNEAGLGSAPIAAAAARTGHPGEQALVSMTGTFIDTIVVCTMTGLVLIVTGVWNQGLDAAQATQHAFNIGLPGPWGGRLLTFGIVTFAYSTVIGWAYYGEKCAEYLFGIHAVLPYRWLWVIAAGVGGAAKAWGGAATEFDLFWNLADVLNALMAVPNLIGLLGLSGVVVEETRRYLAATGR